MRLLLFIRSQDQIVKVAELMLDQLSQRMAEKEQVES